MGGSGSGRWYRWGTKDTVEGCRSLDVRRWARDGLLQPGRWFSWQWTRDGENQASISVQALQDAVELIYTLRPGQPDAEDIRYQVPLTWTPCHLGGRRCWFRCPGVISGVYCGRRVAKLYLGGKYFVCRHCQGLVYESQREDLKDRALRRTQAIRVRLGGHPGLQHGFPAKPKRMRWRTYERLRQEAEEAERGYSLHMVEWMKQADHRVNRILARHEKERHHR
jgi:hypothetical protein